MSGEYEETYMGQRKIKMAGESEIIKSYRLCIGNQLFNNN